mgnify:FL=1|tara:strand:+ start:327 stop:1172 length:846 start_codon:yes stop_codon:yes gene_type:complete
MKAIILNLIAWSTLPIMDGMAKYLSTQMHFLEVVWARYFFMVLLSLPITFIFLRKYLIWPHNFLLQLSRSIFLFLSTICFFYSISVISLAKALTLAFVAPIFVTILSALLLKEKVGIHRWCAVFVGFIGALIIIQPGIIKINLASIASLGAGISYAFYIISTRKLTSFDNPFLTLIFTGVFGAIIISFIVPFYWTMPNVNQWLLMIGLAAVGTFAHFCLILSLNYAEASKLAPLGYFEIVNNVLIGYYFFGDFPNKWLWLGLFFIVSSGIYISIREARKLN